DPTRTERFLFATGDVDGGRVNPNGTVNAGFSNTFAVDRFFLSAGLENFDQKSTRTVASGIRAFLRNQTGLGLNLADSGVFVINTGSNTPEAKNNNSILHADFGMSGTGAAQQSTISATIGDVKYVQNPPCTDCVTNSFEAVVNGRTIGSSRGNVGNGRIATVGISSVLTSTSAGGGNPALNRPGYAGYFVLENFTPEADQLNGGTEHGLGGAITSDENYAVLRLATATGQATVGSRSSQTLTGWAGGLAEKENGTGNPLTIVPIGTGTDPNNFTVQTDAVTNRAQANINLNNRGLLALGGATSPSAFIDDNRFAAGNDEVAMVNANVLRDGNGNLPAALQSIPTYQHLQWGFFFGDTQGTAGSDLEHLHMGTWVAGRAADPSQLPTTGSATYQGHSIGNVFNSGSLYTAVGSYQNNWDFGQRAGAVSMNFDGAQYTGTTRLRDNSAVFEGPLSAGNRTGGAIGNFVQGGGDPAAAMAGRFAVGEAATYRASGTFAGEKR
ncbi:MAG: hypothetical protein H7X91_00825, partial [Burkholderiales bacterium]|nr:hypothetical protein [Burkholderiales bacterium]